MLPSLPRQVELRQLASGEDDDVLVRTLKGLRREEIAVVMSSPYMAEDRPGRLRQLLAANTPLPPFTTTAQTFLSGP